MSVNRTVLVTGGAGYIGSHTCVELLRSGWDVVIADDFSNSSPCVPQRIAQIAGRAPRLYRADVTDKAAVERIFSENDIGSVIHFAGLKAVGESVEQPLRYYENNLMSTVTLAGAMRRHGVRAIAFSSSATVYDASSPMPLREGSPTGGCTSPYGWTKFMCEQILTSAAAAWPEMSVVLLRYFNPIGADKSGLIGEQPNGVPNNLMPYITQTALGLRDHLRVFGSDYPTPDGTGVRDYLHVTDLARGHINALEYAFANSGADVFNLGTGRGTSVIEMADAFERATGVSVPRRIYPRRPGDAAATWCDPGKAARVLGWRAELSVEDACRDSWRWQSMNPNGFEEVITQ